MKIGTPKEVIEGESRVAMTPDSAEQLRKLGHDCVIETGAGVTAGFSDAAFEAAGVEVVKTAAALWKAADVVAKVRPPTDTGHGFEARQRGDQRFCPGCQHDGARAQSFAIDLDFVR